MSPGQDADIRHFIPTMERVRLPSPMGRPRKRCQHIVADKGYDSDDLRRYCDRHRMTPIIAKRKMHRKPRPGAELTPNRWTVSSLSRRPWPESCIARGSGLLVSA